MEPLGLGLIMVIGCVVAGAASMAAALGLRARRRASPLAGAVAIAPRVETVDPITGLPVRYRLIDHLTQRLEDRSHNRGCGVLVFAPDHLSALNGALGHQVGDEVLAEVGSRIAGLARQDDVIARYVGHQVVIITTDVPAERDLTLLAERLIDAAAGPIVLRCGEIHHLTLSVGIAAAFDTDPAADDLLTDAALARRRAEQAGGNRLMRCSAQDRERAQARYELQRDLKVAIVEQQFEVNYQPVIELDLGTAHWFEALVRWRHPRRGLLHPVSFLDQVADLGLAPALNQIVVNEACQQAAAWSANAGRMIRVSINTDYLILADREVVATMERAMTSAGLVAGQLLLEVDQALLDRASEEIRANLDRLVGLGMGIVVDNARVIAGVGWLSAPVVGIKVDQGQLAGPRQAATPDLDHDDELTLIEDALVVATGVERAGQLDRVRLLGIAAAQGFWLQRPAEADQMASLIEESPRTAQSLVVADDTP
ncbi:MAG: EAL domain-containing protein [Actinomycetia bacterium]|nr:EAL domain-containing protein [Actinomycetes bacterium]